MAMKITHAELEALHPDELLEVIDNMEETALFEGTLTQEEVSSYEETKDWSTEARIQRILYISNLEKEVQPKKSNDVLAEKIKYRNDLIAEQAKEIEELKKQLNEAKLENVESNKIIINQKLTIDSLTANVQRKRNLKVKSAEKINELIARNELLEQNLYNTNEELKYRTARVDVIKGEMEEIKKENQVIHTALYEEQEKNVNLEITIKTLTKMVK